MMMGEVMKTAAFSLAEAKFSMSGDFTQVVIQSVSKAQIKIRTKRDNVAGKIDRRGGNVLSTFEILSGVILPSFESFNDGGDSERREEKIVRLECETNFLSFSVRIGRFGSRRNSTATIETKPWRCN